MRVLRVAMILGLLFTASAHAQRRVAFPPAESPPPPPAKEPPRTQTAGEETDILDAPGPTMRKTQTRVPPPPTNLTVMFKLKYGETLEYVHPNGTVQKFEQWKSFPNDAANLVVYTNQRLADGNNYQYMEKGLAEGPFDPVDIPILFMAGDYDFVFTPKEVENLRRFLIDGGTIIFNAARGRDEFNLAAARELRRVFPTKKLMQLPLDHPIFNARYRLKQLNTLINGVQQATPPEIYALDIGTRAAAILVPSGMGTAWSGQEYHPSGKHVVGESAIRLGVNLISYALANTEYGKFLAQEFPTYDGATSVGDVFRYTQVQYAGSWDVNPVVQNSVQAGLYDNTGVAVDFAPHVVRLDDAQLMNYPLVFMTGHYDFELTPAEKTNLASYLKRGGMLIASAAAGLSPFDKAFRREIKQVITDTDLIRLPPTHPLFTGGWNPVNKIIYTPAALRDDPALEYPEFYGLFINNRLAIIYTPWDLMSAVNRESNVYAKGVTPEDALRLMINTITYDLSH